MPTTPPDPDQQWRFTPLQIVGMALAALATVYLGLSCALNGGPVAPSVPPPPPATVAPPVSTAPPFLKVGVQAAGGGYRIVGTTNLPDGTTVRLDQDDAEKPGAVFDEVTVQGGRFTGPTYTLAGKFRATATVPGREVPCNTAPFSFRGGVLIVK